MHKKMHFITYYLLQCIMPTAVSSSTYSSKYRVKNPKNLTVEVNISDEEFNKCFNENVKSISNNMISTKCYNSYLKHILGVDYETVVIHEIFTTLDFMKEYVNFRLSMLNREDVAIVKTALQTNNYFSKNTTRNGAIVKLFPVQYNGKLSVVKTYMYDGDCESIKWSLEQNIKNEILFQNYAKTLNKQFDFVSPELYTWGIIRKYAPVIDEPVYYKVMYLIMEYIPFMTLKEAEHLSFQTHDIYQRIDMMDIELKKNLLFHNDLHSSNILVSTRSPLPEICILDFGEAYCGPRKRIQ